MMKSRHGALFLMLLLVVLSRGAGATTPETTTEAINAIELTNEADDESLKQRLHILDERDRLKDKVNALQEAYGRIFDAWEALRKENKELKTQVERIENTPYSTLVTENEELKGALGRCQANYREMMKQRDRIEAENNELRGQLNDLGNVITEALGNTDYVPF